MPAARVARLFRKFASAVGSLMHIFTPVLSFPRFPQTPGASKSVAMPLLIRFRLAKDLSTLSRVGADRGQALGSLARETNWQRDLSLWRLFKVCTCTFTRHARPHGREPWRVGVIPHKRALQRRALSKSEDAPTRRSSAYLVNEKCLIPWHLVSHN